MNIESKGIPAKQPAAVPKSKVWILYGIVAGFGIGTGNYLVARISQTGGVAIAYVGLVAVFMLLLWRAVGLIQTKQRIGTFIDYTNSNFFT